MRQHLSQVLLVAGITVCKTACKKRLTAWQLAGLLSVVLSFSQPFAHASYFARVNADGFGNPHNTGGLDVKTMAVFQEKLYAGVSNLGEGAQVWRYDGTVWLQANQSGFGSRDNSAIASMTATEHLLYAGTSSRSGGQVWRYDGKEWVCIHQGPFGKTFANTVDSMAIYKGKLYVGIWDQVTSRPAEIWSFDGETTWQQVNTPGFGSPHNLNVTGLAASSVGGQDRLYAIAWKTFTYKGPDAGCDVWAYDEKTWTKVNAGREGFGEKGKGRSGIEPFSIAEYQGKLYVGLWAFGAGIGWEVWSYDGKDRWQLTNARALGTSTALRLCIALQAFNGRLYASVTDGMRDFELWVYDGTDWMKIAGEQCATPKKLGDPNNLVINAMASYKDHLYLGVTNHRTGYQVWQSRLPEITPHNTTLAVKETELYSLTSGAPPITWTSGNQDIAAIDSHTGFVQALKPGISVISAADNFGFRSAPLELAVSGAAAKAHTEKMLIFSEAVPASVVNSGTGTALVTAQIYGLTDRGSLDAVEADLSPLKLGSLLLTYDDTSGSKTQDGGVYSHEITIPADIPAGTYACRVTARTKQGITRTSAFTVSVTQAYIVPQITGIKTVGTMYHIPVLFELKGPGRELCSVTVEFRKDQGTWQPASIESTSGTILPPRPGQSGTPAAVINHLATPLQVNHFICVWQAEKDIGQTSGTCSIRLTPADSKSKGNPVESPPFTIDNRVPPASEMVYVPAGKFYIDKYEYPNHRGYYPLLNKTWYEARKTCQEQGKDLCTPQQWETAYYGAARHRYPYGNEYGSRDREFCNTKGAADDVPVPSGIYENCVNDLGIYDMGGNVYEWVGLDDKQAFMADQSYLTDALSQSLLNVEDPTHRHEYLGFRCCKPE